MVEIRTGIRSEQVRAGGEHVLFVEGSDESLDQVVLRALLSNTLRVEVMGPSYSVRSAAQALAPHHPRYYFLIDRDHYDDEFIEQSWRRFPDANQDNLLVWRRREIENYFLDPPFLVKSEFCRTSMEGLTTTLENVAQERLFLDVANSVISSVREKQKMNWVQHFANPADFASKEAAVERLISQEAFVERSKEVSEMLSQDELTRWFEERLALMTGGRETLTYGMGRWIEMISGKKVLSQLLNPGRFQVKNKEGQTLTGKEMQKEIVRQLAVKNVNSRPSNLVELRRLVLERVEGK
ncbi:MAG: hypothetical protein TQ37_06780 [Candidatus Synechococcus spongiarum 15L]|uniref:DUF4435 domain-containing protein n=1 Tax=Candidatus Synechococcus spongiarum 15L TaxID=1608419 RepID=A0A0G8AUH9_9SYNE|nr:MAG: hypothetical protein TQ37_06780 [Candidatus Synechococcus spongiarum 15L]